MTRKIVHRTRGYGAGPIVRLMSPSDLGEQLKPFVFLDLFEADMRGLAGGMPVHPHSGIATVTVFTDGDVTFDDPQAGHGTIGYGGVEWVRAGRGMWHGKELSAGTSPTTQGFQLWVALPPDLENAEPEAQYIGTEQIPTHRSGSPHRRCVQGSDESGASPCRDQLSARHAETRRALDVRAARWSHDRVGRDRKGRAHRRRACVEGRARDLRQE